MSLSIRAAYPNAACFMDRAKATVLSGVIWRFDTTRTPKYAKIGSETRENAVHTPSGIPMIIEMMAKIVVEAPFGCGPENTGIPKSCR